MTTLEHTIAPDKETKEPTADPIPQSGAGLKDVNVVSLKGFLGVKDTTAEEDSALEYIYRFFEEAGVESMAEMLLNIKEIEMRLGVAQLGESRVIKLRNYLKLDGQIQELIKMKKSLEREL